MKQTIRDAVTGDVSLEYFAKRFGEGWKITSIEWFREGGTSSATEPTNVMSEQDGLPYGFEVAGGGLVQENPLEATVLLLILEQIVREKRITEIAVELNRQGYSTRVGKAWTAPDVFNLLPRLIETGPSLLKSEAWRQRRATTEARVS